MTRDRQVGVKSVSGQRAVEEVLVRAQVVALGGGGAGQAEILVVGASSATDPLDCLLSSQLSDLNTEEQGPDLSFIWCIVKLFNAFFMYGQAFNNNTTLSNCKLHKLWLRVHFLPF